MGVYRLPFRQLPAQYDCRPASSLKGCPVDLEPGRTPARHYHGLIPLDQSCRLGILEVKIAGVRPDELPLVRLQFIQSISPRTNRSK